MTRQESFRKINLAEGISNKMQRIMREIHDAELRVTKLLEGIKYEPAYRRWLKTLLADQFTSLRKKAKTLDKLQKSLIAYKQELGV